MFRFIDVHRDPLYTWIAKPHEQEGAPMQTKNATTLDADAIAKSLLNTVGEAAVLRIARSTRLTKRMRDVTPLPLLIACISALGASETNWIADILRAFNAFTRKSVQYKPFHNQLRKAAFPEFIRLVLEEALSKLTMPVLRGLPSSKLAVFKDIRIHDGTSFAVKDSLRRLWPGRFSKVSPAAVELHVTMSALEDNPIQILLAADKESEQHFAPDPDTLGGILMLEDRGYQNRARFRSIQQARGHFITRGTKSIRPTIRKVYDAHGRRSRRLRRLEGKRLSWEILPRETVDIDIEWRCPDGSIYEGRLVAIYRPGKRNSKSFVYLHTNLTRETFSVEDVGKIYRLRWQIELLFKEWKSLTNLHRFDTSMPAIAEGLIWASVLTATLKRIVTHAAEQILGVELSTQRAAAGAKHFLDAILRSILRGSRRVLRRALDDAFAYLHGNGRRAHPDRDRESGRYSSGLCPIVSS